MSTTTTISITHGKRQSKKPLPTGDVLADIIVRHAEVDMTDFSTSFGGTYNHAYFQTNSRWTLDGMVDAALAISKKYPGKIVLLNQEWDSRDADEQGEEQFEYRSGKLVATYGLELVRKPVVS
jgi:predicted ATP-grasp superfamily ATP-dependent carboligase